MAREKRAYSSEVREAQAEKTRSRILKAAKKLFLSLGFDSVTITKIAEAADVAAPTIYAIFKSKRGVLQALIDEALPEAQFLLLVERSMSEKTPKKRLQACAEMARQIYDAERGLMDLFREASVVASEFRELEEERENRRYDHQQEYVKSLPLSKHLTLTQARDILWSLTGRDLYRLLVLERGWSSDAYEKWLGDTLINALL